MITIFQTYDDILNPKYISIETALKRIREGKSKHLLDKVSAGELEKKQLPSVIFSGKADVKVEKVSKKGNKYFTYRCDESVSSHSGYFILDFDKLSMSPHEKKEHLSKDPYIYAAWVSPSGNGVKALVKCIPSLEKHAGMYTAFLARYPELDTTSRNISRLCFESYDPNIYINLSAYTWEKWISEEQHVKTRQVASERRNYKLLATAADMIRSSYDGVKHDTLLKASNLLGGYIATGRVSEDDAIALLEGEVKLKSPKDFSVAQKTIRDGIEHGKKLPIQEAKKIEKSVEFTKRKDGSYDFIADKEEMDIYEKALLEGTLEMGLPTNTFLDNHWMLKKHHLVFFMGLDNSGKSFFLWWVAVVSALLHGWRIALFSAENNDGQVRKKLKEFFIGKKLTEFNAMEKEYADAFIENHFRIFTSKGLYAWEDILMRAEILHDEGWDFEVFIAEPYNAMDIPNGLDSHRHNLKSLNILRVFKENYCSVWIADHAGTPAARNREDGVVKRPYKSDVDGGQLKANKADDFVVIHRQADNPDMKWTTEVYVDKVKDVETGGSRTMKDNPVLFVAHHSLCGFYCNGKDPIANWWKSQVSEQSKMFGNYGE